MLTTITSLSVGFALLQKPAYEAEGKMVLKGVSLPSIYAAVSKEEDRLGARAPLGNLTQTQAELIQSTSFLQGVVKTLDLRDDNGKSLAVSDFRRRLTVRAINATDLVKVSFKDKDAQRAADVVNQLMAQLIETSIQGNRAEIVKAKRFLQKQVPEAENELRQAETDVRQFLQANQLIALTEQVKASEGRTHDLQGQIEDLQAQVANTEAQMAATSQRLGMTPEQAIALASLSQSSEVQEAIKNIQTAESQLGQERNRLTDDHPSVVQLDAKLAADKRLLQQTLTKVWKTQQTIVAVPEAYQRIGSFKKEWLEELVRLDVTRQGLLKQSKDLSNALIEHRQKSTNLPWLVQQHNQLERKVQAAQSHYTGLVQQLKDTKLAENQPQGNGKIVALAIPPDRPSGLTKTMIIGSGVLLGLMGAVATVVLLEMTGQMIRTAEDAKHAFKLKILGIIPTSGRSRNLLFYDGGTAYPIPEVAVRDKPGSPTCEAYRLLQAHLKVLNTKHRQRVMLVTSATPEEGTSSICANLGAAIAQTHRRVLIIDANLHTPVQDEIWFISQMEGLSNLLRENSSPWAVVHNVAPNVDILPFGNAVSSEPIDLDNARMEALIEHFSNLYDLVILDTPALNVSADTALLGSLADSIIVVARPNQVDFGNVSAVLPILEQWGDRVLGLVINGVPLNQATYSYGVPDAPVAPDTSPGISVPSARASKHSPQPFNSDIPEAPPSHLPQEPSAELQPDDHQVLNPADLARLSDTELEKLVETLSQNWLRATRLIQEQEEELDLQSQTVSELQSRLHSARDYHHHAASEYGKLSLEVQLADEQERKRLLDQTLGGQRQRLRRQHETLRQSFELLRKKQGSACKIVLPKLDDFTVAANPGNPYLSGR